MKPNEPVDPRVRLAIARWPDDAPRGSVTTFCVEHEISRKTFYAIRKRALTEGQAAALEPRSRRPKSSPSRIRNEVKHQALEVRASLENSGLDHGPISVFERMKSMGLVPPSEASLARIFREAGVARLEPNKKPRAAWRRFVYPAPNACWQMDATEYVLVGGRKCVIFQLEDDHSRVEVASHVAPSETADAALITFKKGIAARGVPQRLLTDNGSALNPTRRGWTGKLVDYATSLGVRPITGKPGRPTTQGKNERLHRTLFKYLDKQPIAATIAELQTHVDAFDVIYNNERPHQALPGRVRPQQAWDATPVAEPPRPSPADAPAGRARGDARGGALRRADGKGVVTILGIRFMIGKAHARQALHVVWDLTTVAFFDERGTELTSYDRPNPGTTTVGNNKPRGFMARYDTPTPNQQTNELSPMS